jgi:hypothetical protein
MSSKKTIYQKVKQYQGSLPPYFHNLIDWSNCQLD